MKQFLSIYNVNVTEYYFFADTNIPAAKARVNISADVGDTAGHTA